MDNITLRNDEIQALSAIYGEEWITEDEANNVYSITLKYDNNINNDCQQRSQLCERMIRFEIRLPDEYPLESMPFYTLSAPWMSRKGKIALMSSLEEIYCLHSGQSILYMWIEKAREFLINDNQNENTNNKDCQSSQDINEDEESLDLTNSTNNLSLGSNESYSQHNHNQHHSQTHSHNQHNEEPNSNVSLHVYHGEPFMDRRSTFQAHLSPVHTVSEAHEALSSLKSNKKIESATHNISAYRISGGPHNTCLQDCDDDGENHAGSRLLHLLQILEVKNVLVVVSRWYGGIQLGPDRFKHINNAARDLLQKCGYIDSHEDSNDAIHKNKKKSK